MRNVRIAAGVPLLLLASLGVLASTAGWRISGFLFLDEESVLESPAIAEIVGEQTTWPGERSVSSFSSPTNGWPSSIGEALTDISTAEPITFVWRRLTRPLRLSFESDLGVARFAYLLSGGLISLFVWALLGGAISRVAVVRLAQDQRVGLSEALNHARGHLGSYFTAPVLPLLGIAGLVLPMALLGLLMRLDLGVLLGGILWGFVLLASVGIAILLVGLLLAWPLLWGSIACEESDAFDALSRSYGYVFQRPAQYAFYVIVAVALGCLGWLFVGLFGEGVIGLGAWGTSWGSGSNRTREIFVLPKIGSDDFATVDADAVEAEEGSRATDDESSNDETGRDESGNDETTNGEAANDDNESGTDGPSVSMRGGRWFLGHWNGAIRTAIVSFAFSYFWTASSAIYLLMRRDVDHTDMDEVVMEDVASYDLPPLEPDEAGVPGVAESDAASSGQTDEPQDGDAPDAPSSPPESP